MDDLLLAHGIMTRGLVEELGMFRARPIGVVDNEGRVLHFGTLPQYVPDLVLKLLEWVKTSDVHMLIRSCVFHYELELIHPFADGNGRMGRLWHTLLLSKWNPVFAWLPVESIIRFFHLWRPLALKQSVASMIPLVQFKITQETCIIYVVFAPQTIAKPCGHIMQIAMKDSASATILKV